MVHEIYILETSKKNIRVGREDSARLGCFDRLDVKIQFAREGQGHTQTRGLAVNESPSADIPRPRDRWLGFQTVGSTADVRTRRCGSQPGSVPRTSGRSAPRYKEVTNIF